MDDESQDEMTRRFVQFMTERGIEGYFLPSHLVSADLKLSKADERFLKSLRISWRTNENTDVL